MRMEAGGKRRVLLWVKCTPTYHRRQDQQVARLTMPPRGETTFGEVAKAATSFEFPPELFYVDPEPRSDDLFMGISQAGTVVLRGFPSMGQLQRAMRSSFGPVIVSV